MGGLHSGADLSGDVPAAFHERQFRFYYQRMVRLEDGGDVGFEALARWEHPVLGLIYPATFLPLIERLGLMGELTRALLEQVTGDAARWRSNGFHPGSIAVNLPGIMLATRFAVDEIELALARHALPGRTLTVEVSEAALASPLAEIIETHLCDLSQHGVRLALDDFGTGYASLDQLRAFPFDEIKLDRKLVAQIGEDPIADRILAAMIELATNLGKTTLAEGIESHGQRLFLRDNGCVLGQGFLFGRPVPVETVTRRLGAGATAPAVLLARRAAEEVA